MLTCSANKDQRGAPAFEPITKLYKRSTSQRLFLFLSHNNVVPVANINNRLKAFKSRAPILRSIEQHGQSQQTQQRPESKSIYLAKPEVRGVKDEVAGLGEVGRVQRGRVSPFNISDLIRIAVAVGEKQGGLKG